MIDLSHLTEEEQGVIMAVLRRDAELKKNEEERIRKLETILNSDKQSDGNLKYLTGEWFYEAKSRRHMDKIHGSEIILASMKHGKAASLDGSLRLERSKTPSGRSSDIVAPQKPARCLEALQPQELNDAEKENRNSTVRSPRTPRHNPFNRASLIVVEPPENNQDLPTSRDRESQETEPLSPLKRHPAAEAGQTSGGSVTSEGSSVGFRPVPKKRTFLSRRTSNQSEGNGLGSDPQTGSAGIVPAPRRSLQRGSSGSSNQSCLRSPDEAQPSRSAEENSLQPPCDVSHVFSDSSLERGRNPRSATRDRPVTHTWSDVSAERGTPQRSEERGDQILQPSSNIQDKEIYSRMGAAMMQEELSLPQSTVDPDPPVSYDLNFIDKSDQQTQKSNQTHVFKLSTQTTSPTGEEEEDSIAKVLDWFSRSTDSSDWLNTDDGGPEVTKSSGKQVSKTRLSLIHI